jgi:hypothetical protein
MAKSRYRFRVTGVSPKANDHGAWNSPIKLGFFRDQVTEYQLGVPISHWGLPFNPQTYVPEVSACTVEQTWDELHPRSKRSTVSHTRKGDDPWYSAGGPFLRVYIDTGLPQNGVVGSGTYYSVDGKRRYEGGFMPPNNSAWGDGWALAPLSFTGNSNALLPDVAPYYDRAWRKAKPELEMAGLYVALREIGDTVPMLQTSAKAFGLSWQSAVKSELGNVVHGTNLSLRKMQPRDLAEHFINHEFGWAPFLGDLKSFYTTYLDASDIVKRITRENGKWIRRKVMVDKSSSNEVIYSTTLPPSSSSYAIPCFPVGFPAEFFVSPPSWSVVEQTRMTIHASGIFRFYRPEFDITLPDYSSAWNKVKRAWKIYGMEVSPYHIWQATPWSWLVDWVTNLGSYIQRLSDTLEDQVAALYFYITCHKSVERTMTVNLPLTNGHKVLTFTRSYSSKQRVSADSPYGFHVSWDALSPERLAILGALGITKSGLRKTLH